MDGRKPKLRKTLKGVRQGMPNGVVRAKSQVIAGKLLKGVDWAGIKNLHIYSSVPEWNEVDTGPIIKYVRSQWPKIKISSPPSKPNQSPPSQKFDLIIAPCLGFNKDCFRLGLGGGFYDRFLAGQPQAHKIGLCFHNGFIEDDLPREPHDILLDRIITEEVIIEAHGS